MRLSLESLRETARDRMHAEACDTPESCRRYELAEDDFYEARRQVEVVGNAFWQHDFAIAGCMMNILGTESN